MKKFLSFLLSICLVLQLISPAFAAEDSVGVVASGTCGQNIAWVLADDGTLVLTGSGRMYDYTNSSDAPWSDMFVAAVAVDEGVTYIGKNAFASCADLSTIIFFGAAPTFSSGAFLGVTAAAVYIPGSSWTDAVMQNYGGTIYWMPGIAEVPTITKVWAPYNGQLIVVINEVPYAVGYAFYRRPANVAGAEFELIGVTEADGDDTATFIHRTGVDGTTYEYKVSSIGILGIESQMSDAKSGLFQALMSGPADIMDIRMDARTMYYYGLHFGFYAEGETPSAELMYHITPRLSPDKTWLEYAVNAGEITHEIPRAAFEEVVFTLFPYSAAAVAELRNSAYYSAETECYYLVKSNFNPFTDSPYHYYSLESDSLGDDLYQINAWNTRQLNEDGTAYEPAAGDEYAVNYDTPVKIISDFTAKVQYVNSRPMFLSIALSEHTPHDHVLSKVDAREPDCWHDGNIAHYRCYCGRAFADTAATQPIANPLLPNLQHVEKIMPGFAPTCTSNGMTDWKKCALCGLQMFPPSTLYKLGHAIVNTPTVPASCTNAGSEGGTHCSRCAQVFTQPTVIPKQPHTAVAIPDVPASCTNVGSEGGTHCSLCGEVLTQPTVIPQQPHTAVTSPVVLPATCTSVGSGYGTHCSLCGEVLTQPTVIPKAAHTFDGGICTVCGAAQVNELLGDFNLDGSVDSMDTNLLFRYANADATLGDLTELQLLMADANRDGFVDSMDTNLLFRYANGDPTLLWTPLSM